jgi:hypothetical protein
VAGPCAPWWKRRRHLDLRPANVPGVPLTARTVSALRTAVAQVAVALAANASPMGLDLGYAGRPWPTQPRSLSRVPPADFELASSTMERGHF